MKGKLIMKIKKTIPAVLALLSVLLISGCGNTKTANEYIDLSVETVKDVEEEQKEVSVTVFFRDKNGYLIPVDTTIPWTEGIAKAVIRKMMSTSELQKDIVTMGLESLMPPEAAINGLDISNGLAKIDFTTAKLTFSSAKAEQNFVDGVVLALTAFPTVKEVQFMFNGHIIDALPNGTPVDKPLKATDVNPTGLPLSGEAVSVFYYATSDTDYNYIVPVTVYMKNATCFEALQSLISGSPDEALCSVPAGTKLVSVETIADTLCIFLSEEFNALKSTPSLEAATMKSIALTAGRFSDDRIKIYAGSKEYVPNESIDRETFANII